MIYSLPLACSVLRTVVYQTALGFATCSVVPGAEETSPGGPRLSPDLLNQKLHFNKSSGDFCTHLGVTAPGNPSLCPAVGWAFYEDRVIEYVQCF